MAAGGGNRKEKMMGRADEHQPLGDRRGAEDATVGVPLPKRLARWRTAAADRKRGQVPLRAAHIDNAGFLDFTRFGVGEIAEVPLPLVLQPGLRFALRD